VQTETLLLSSFNLNCNFPAKVRTKAEYYTQKKKDFQLFSVRYVLKNS